MRYSVIALVTIAIFLANMLGRETGYRHGLRDAPDVATEERRWHDEIAARTVAAHPKPRADCPEAANAGATTRQVIAGAALR